MCAHARPAACLPAYLPTYIQDSDMDIRTPTTNHLSKYLIGLLTCLGTCKTDHRCTGSIWMRQCRQVEYFGHCFGLAVHFRRSLRPDLYGRRQRQALGYAPRSHHFESPFRELGRTCQRIAKIGSGFGVQSCSSPKPVNEDIGEGDAAAEARLAGVKPQVSVCSGEG